MVTNIDEKVYSFKRKIHNRLKENETDGSFYRGSVVSSRMKSSRSSSSSKHSAEDRFMEEKLKVAELLAEQSFKVVQPQVFKLIYNMHLIICVRTVKTI